jgi:hypothetical protein
MDHFAVFMFFAVVVVAAVWKDRRRADARRDIQLALLNKFSSAEEVRQFLVTKEGARLMDQLATPDRSRDPRAHTVRMVIGACLALSVGAGFFLLAHTDDNLATPAILAAALGIGLLIAAAVGHFLAKRLGLHDKED